MYMVWADTPSQRNPGCTIIAGYLALIKVWQNRIENGGDHRWRSFWTGPVNQDWMLNANHRFGKHLFHKSWDTKDEAKAHVEDWLTSVFEGQI